MRKLTTLQKKQMIAELIELRVQTGYEILDLIGVPLSRFNYDAVQNSINYYRAIYEAM